MSKLSLVVMAAGQGSRFGGAKQLATFGTRKLTIAEFNILNAIDAGFSHFVFIIQRQMAEIFRDRLLRFLPKNCSFEFAFQEIPEIFSGRTKPLGTGHALLCAKNCDFDHCNFGVINADDFYGRDAMFVLSDCLNFKVKDVKFANVAFELGNTLSDNGSVSRGVMSVKNGTLLHIDEIYEIFRDSVGVISGKDKNNNCLHLSGREFVSMNLWGFSPVIFNLLDARFATFCKSCKDHSNDEFALPTAIDKSMANGMCSVCVCSTKSDWVGVTYASDCIKLDKIFM